MFELHVEKSNKLKKKSNEKPNPLKYLSLSVLIETIYNFKIAFITQLVT